MANQGTETNTERRLQPGDRNPLLWISISDIPSQSQSENTAKEAAPSFLYISLQQDARILALPSVSLWIVRRKRGRVDGTEVVGVSQHRGVQLEHTF